MDMCEYTFMHGLITQVPFDATFLVDANVTRWGHKRVSDPTCCELNLSDDVNHHLYCSIFGYYRL